MQIINNFERVKDLLYKSKKYRESDNKLIARFWWDELKRKQNVVTVEDFLKLVAEGKITTPESITRARRKVQEKHPELRGSNYTKRQKEQDNVKTQLGYKLFN